MPFEVVCLGVGYFQGEFLKRQSVRSDFGWVSTTLHFEMGRNRKFVMALTVIARKSEADAVRQLNIRTPMSGARD